MPKPHQTNAIKVTEEFFLHNDHQRYYVSPDSSRAVRAENARRFSFEFFRKRTMLGEVPIDQFWMALPSVYGQRNRKARNGDAIIEYFWERCLGTLAVMERDVQESYILAKMLPMVRSNGSRKIFEDAVISRPGQTARTKIDLIKKLDQLLSQNLHDKKPRSFREQSAKILGPPEMSKGIKKLYVQRQSELLDEACEVIERRGATAGFNVAVDRWKDLTRRYGRRKGNQADKEVLNIISYECRAAMHRCYSVLWDDLIPYLAERYAWNRPSINFHKLWHLDHCVDLPEQLARFHAFHGHVFALHPGTGVFAQTQTGMKLIADVVKISADEAAVTRLLNGLLVALYEYADRGSEIDLARKRCDVVDLSS